jgi:hypothetical protein
VERLIFILAALIVSAANAEEKTTGNLLPNLSEFSVSGTAATSSLSGCAVGEYCTGNASNDGVGTTYTSDFSVGLSADEIRQGFTLNTGVTIANSHSSNATLASCTGGVSQATDCRDLFSASVTLFDGADVAIKFSKQFELDFGGTASYAWSDKVGENSWSNLTGTFQLWGVDAGYHPTSAYGPKFGATPSLSITYQTSWIEQQIINEITAADVQIAMPPPIAVEVTLPPPMAAAPPVQMAAINVRPPAPPAPPTTVAAIAPSQPEVRQEVQQAEAEIESELRIEPPASAVVRPQATPSREAPRQTKREKTAAAAERVVKRIAPSQRYTSQTTIMVAMSMLSGKIATGPKIVDPSAEKFFSSNGLKDAPSMVDTLTNYRMVAGGDISPLIDLQWAK